MFNKIAPSIEAALAGVKDGSTVMIGGFGTAGIPNELIDGLIAQGAKDLVIVNNNAGNADTGLAALPYCAPSWWYLAPRQAIRASSQSASCGRPSVCVHSAMACTQWRSCGQRARVRASGKASTSPGTRAKCSVTSRCQSAVTLAGGAGTSSVAVSTRALTLRLRRAWPLLKKQTWLAGARGLMRAV